jgi:alpha-mannosidase
MGRGLIPWGGPLRLAAAEWGETEDNPNLVDAARGATATASTYSITPPWAYSPQSIFEDLLQTSWETEKETGGAWLEIAFRGEATVSEIWILPKPIPYDIVLDPYTRGGKMATPRNITCSLAGGPSIRATLQPSPSFQIISIPQAPRTQSLRITIHDTWPEANTVGTGLGKIRAFARPHATSFEIIPYAMYDARDGEAVQSATIEIINREDEVRDGALQVWREGKMVMTLPLEPIPGRACSWQNIWIPAPYEDQAFEFRITDKRSTFKTGWKTTIPAYHSYFEGGTFDLFTTCHNDMGWLDTQAVTADYRSAEIILPAMDLLKKYPDFRYSMESVVYLREFLDRHPEKREEMAQLMRERRFIWGASYVQNLEAKVGPENLVRQFYLGRRWLRKNFPGTDTIHYCKTDPPGMTLQMPQILRKAGIQFAIQGRFPWGFYNWEAPDGSRTFVFALLYADPRRLPDPKGNRGWLSYAAQREYFYEPRKLPPQMIFDFNADYLPPPPSLITFAHEQNEAMKRFSAAWNEHYRGQLERQIKPPVIRFVEPEGAIAELRGHALNLETLKGDWPLNWAYYDEPGHRTGLLAGREAHNRILAAERLSAGLRQFDPSATHPTETFADAWQTNCWPDHGWGGNRGTQTDANYVASYEKSRDLADKLLRDAGASLARSIAPGPAEQLAVAVYNPLSWPRTDAVQLRFDKPAGWNFFRLLDEAGKEVPCQILDTASRGPAVELCFVAEDVPSVGYRTYCLAPGTSPIAKGEASSGDRLENDCLRAILGAGGLTRLYDKRREFEILKTDKFFGGEILQFTALGFAWDDPQLVTTEDFEKTSHHGLRDLGLSQGPVTASAVREAQFKHFRLRQSFRLYAKLDRLEMDVDVLDWDGAKARELRVAFPINLPDSFRLSYEVPFGTVEMGKDEMDFSLLPWGEPIHRLTSYGGDHTLPFREAINWIDASSDRFGQYGCLAASNCTVHLFKDQTDNPVSYPLLQHVLLCSRKSQAWSPEYWFTQEGSHHFRMALYPHRGGWRARYRDGIAFNYPLIAFVADEARNAGASLPPSGAFLSLEPSNLIVTAMKKSEDDDSLALRFYEAEGSAVRAHLRLGRPIRQAWRTNLIEEEPAAIPVTSGGTVEFDVGPWEIVTLRLAV